VECYRRQNTDDDRRQRAKQYWPPTLCAGGPVIITSNETIEYVKNDGPTVHDIVIAFGSLCAVVQRVERWSCDQQVVGSNPTRSTATHNNLGQVVHTYVTLSPSSITCYRPRGGDALRLGR